MAKRFYFIIADTEKSCIALVPTSQFICLLLNLDLLAIDYRYNKSGC